MRDIQCKSCANYKNEWCEKIIDSPDPDLVRDCQYYRMRTNADRIRDMTDEELAEFINKHDCHTNLYGYDPKEAILDWLKQEVKEMSDRYLYDPKHCDGRLCIADCDNCDVAEEMIENEKEGWRDITVRIYNNVFERALDDTLSTITCKPQNSPSDERTASKDINIPSSTNRAETDGFPKFTKDQIETMKRAIAIYGQAGQIDVAIEEMSELIKALLKHRRAWAQLSAGTKTRNFDIRSFRDAVDEELADVLIMCYQLLIIFGVRNEVQEQVNFKLNRLEKRING